jgi:ubiquinone/menaquinone biosynthesis C-methylase UbiE
MPTQDEIYQTEAEGYDHLVQREDYQGNLLPALEAIVPFAGKAVIDLGTGTGRVAGLLCGRAETILGFDVSIAMLRVARSRLQALTGGRWGLALGDNRRLPIRAACADVVLAGWSYGHATVWYEDRWRDEIDPAIHEQLRLLHPGGTAIICETLGTGSLEPIEPTPTLAAYYRFLESDWGFTRAVVPTDYRFTSLAEAVETVGFFFGDELAAKVKANRWVVVPEWTGIWWRRK